jgi:ribosomal protein S15P/S13E
MNYHLKMVGHRRLLDYLKSKDYGKYAEFTPPLIKGPFIVDN